jgi:Fic family protein
MSSTYIWQSPDWPRFHWDVARLSPLLASARLAQGRLLGKIAGLGFDLHLSQRARVLTEEAIRTAAIEGEVLDPEAVRSSVGRRLGLPVPSGKTVPRHVDGLLDVLLDATTKFHEPLTAARIKSWQGALFPTGRSGMKEIVVGDFRPPGPPMQVVSGPLGRERVHFEAPPSEEVARELQAFLAWFESAQGDTDGLLRAGIAHFWFVTIHPFDDGNGRLARAIGEMALAQDDGLPERFYSLSAQIESAREAYYRPLEQTQKGHGDLSDWLAWFLESIERATIRSEVEIDLALAQSRFWQEHAGKPLNERQLKIIRRVLKAAPGAFEGGLTTRKAAHLTHASPATAQRDLADLLTKGVIRRNDAGGRSTSYELVGYQVRAQGSRPELTR